MICLPSASGARAGEQTFVDDTLEPWNEQSVSQLPSSQISAHEIRRISVIVSKKAY